MAMGGGGKKGIKNDINVTPLIDVVLVLLIIFMVITPMLQRGKDVQLPSAHKTDAEHKESDPLILSLTKDRKIYVEADALDEATLPDRLRQEFAQQPNRRILLKGDERLTFGDVRKVMDIVRKSGGKAVSLGVQEKK
ncbi:MAG TPA: biopolymer transporter ExbD [Byssovorax sp.]|jgi:biopolymer transport protein ExbD